MPPEGLDCLVWGEIGLTFVWRLVGSVYRDVKVSEVVFVGNGTDTGHAGNTLESVRMSEGRSTLRFCHQSLRLLDDPLR
jgi:hypothetical protein